jgi:hypothetical protein
LKYELTPPFDADWRRLSPEERVLFRRAVDEINRAYSQRGASPVPRWPAHLRVKALQGHRGIWEMTWSFSGPDGRATFEFVDMDGDLGIRWRRVGDHRIFERP